MADLMGSGLSPLADPALMRQSGSSSALRSRAFLDQLRAGNRGTDPEATRQALRQASQELESVFMNQLVSAMRKTVGDGGLIEKGEGEKIFEGMLDEEWARSLSGRSGPGGLSEMIYSQLSRRMGLEPDTVPGHPLLTPSATLPPAGLLPIPAGDLNR